MAIEPHATSVVICAYTEDRWGDLLDAIESVRRQIAPPGEIIVVVDHNPRLLERLRRTASDLIVVENDRARGLSGARNSGIAASSGAVVAFLDDDAVAEPGWLKQLSSGYQDPQVLGVGGLPEPLWLASRPRWFPEEFYWVVGGAYRGLPVNPAPVRNFIGANMSFRRDVVDQVGGFRDGVGQVGAGMLRCEDTEFCIRVRQHYPDGVLLYLPRARVKHRVPPQRTRWSYFRTRCYTEGQAKAIVSRLVGTHDSLGSEWNYTLKTLPLGVLRNLRDVLHRGDLAGFARGAAILAGLAITTSGYVRGIQQQQDPFARARRSQCVS